MSSEPSQNHLEARHQLIEAAIEAADLFPTSLEEQIKLGAFTAQMETARDRPNQWDEVKQFLFRL